MGVVGNGQEEPALSVRLLGGFSVRADGDPVAVDSTRAQSLLAFLILHQGEEQPRERLAYLFWPESGESQARTNMRQTLHRLKNALPDPDLYLNVGKSTLAWRTDAPSQLDVAEFEALSAGDEDGARRAVELYGGDLFPECYDDWIVPIREGLRETFLATAERLADSFERERDYRRALPLARQIAESDTFNEEALLRLMRLHALSGDRSAALHAYHGYATSLAKSTGVEPSPELRVAYERLVEPEAEREDSRTAGPFIGRKNEWSALREAWRRASRGAAILLTVSGEAGIGKSRLAEEFQEWVTSQGYAAATSKCYSASTGLAYAPLAEFLRSDPVGESAAGLGDPWLVELSRLVPELREGRPDLPLPLPLADEAHRTRLLEGVSRALLVSGSPLLLLLDDIQWCDEETIDWLRYLLRSNPSAPVLVLATARSEELHSTHPARKLVLEGLATDQAVRVELEPLDAEETAALAESVAGRGLGEERSETIFRETEGNPLFVVEWTRAGITVEPEHIPPRVQSVIETRFAQLSAGGQDLASLAATVGRAFDFEVLASASSSPEDDVIDALDELTDRRVVRELPGAAYDFSHDKLREVAYERVGEARRRMLHRRVAQAIESHTRDLDAVAPDLGAHYEEAGWIDRAAAFYARAGEAAHRVYSNERAIALFEKALALLEEEPDSPERDRRELALRTALGAPLVSIEGYGAPKVHTDYQRAWELCERLGSPPAPPILRGLALVSIARGELERARAFGEQLIEEGVSGDDSTVRVEGNYVLGVTSFWLGEFERSREMLERAIAEYDPLQAHAHIAMYSQDPKAICLARLALTLHYLGDAEEANERAREAILHAEELEHPFSLAYALNFAAWVAIERGDKDAARERAERMAALADDQLLGFVQPMGTILRGWLLAEDGETDDGVALIREGIEAYTASGWSLYQPYALALLARACIAAGRDEEARGAIAEALDLSRRTGQRYLDPELHRLERELTHA